MTSLYETLKASKLGGAAPDMFTALLANKLAAEEVEKTISGIPPLTFKSNGTPLTSWQIDGNTVQSGTPTPDNPIMPEGCGELEAGQYKIPILSANTTTPVYLGEVETTRWIKKLVLDGTEDWDDSALTPSQKYFRLKNFSQAQVGKVVCTHYISPDENISINNTVQGVKVQSSTLGMLLIIRPPEYSTWDVNDFKAYLAAQYAASTPVTVWYVLTEPETGIVNEPLRKIGDYADSISDAATIPTAKGTNTLTVGTTVQPSSMTITYKEG